MVVFRTQPRADISLGTATHSTWPSSPMMQWTSSLDPPGWTLLPNTLISPKQVVYHQPTLSTCWASNWLDQG